MGQRKITFYADIISPFGYIAYWMLQNSPAFKDVSITYIPILLGGLHKQCNNTAPILIKNKDKWINKERTRWATQFQIPIREGAPPGFPVSTVNAMRVLTALHMEVNDQEQFTKVLEALWSAIWCPEAQVLNEAKGRNENGEFDVKNPETLKALVGGVVGEDVAAKVVGRTAEKEVKDKLIANTNAAFEAGAFGIPWFQCTNAEGEEEGFWGFDHLGQVVKFLGIDEGADAGRSGQMLRALL